MDKIAYTLAEAGPAVGYSRSTIEKQIALGNLVPRYVNSKPVIPADELKRWLSTLPEVSPRDKKKASL
jgi:hypothetical protein